MSTGQGDADRHPEFAELRKDFPGYYYWRAKKWDGSPGSYMATRVNKGAGVDRTLMARDVPALRALLVRQKATVENGGTPPRVATSPDAFWNPAYI